MLGKWAAQLAMPDPCGHVISMSSRVCLQVHRSVVMSILGQFNRRNKKDVLTQQQSDRKYGIINFK